MLCGTCGPSTALLRCDGPPDSAPIELCCERCQAATAEAVQPGLLSASCRHCGAEDLGWLDGRDHFWSPTLEPLEGKLGRWVRADFDGIYEGRDPRGSRSLIVAAHRFELSITAAQWRGMEFMPGPPTRRREDEATDPWRQDVVRGVFVVCDAEGVEERFEGALEDFRLHDWLFTSLEQSMSSGSRVTGRLRGTAYGRLVKPVTAPGTPDEKIVAPPTPEADEADAIEPPAPRGPDPKPAPEERLNHCGRCSPLVLSVASVVVWMLCSFGAALASAAVLTAQCVLHQWIVRAGLSLRARRAVLLGLIVLAVSLFSAFHVLAGSSGECGRVGWSWIVLLALSFFAAAWHPRCWPRVIAGVMLLLALVLTCRLDPNGCTPGTGPVSRVNSTLSEAVSSWMSRLRFDETGDVIDDLPPVESMLMTGGARVSIDQALARPSMYFSCEAPDGDGEAGATPFNIYFGEATLFRLNDATLRPEAEFALRKLALLIRSNPRSRVTLTGHTDSTGDEGFNLSLSSARASAVAEWLISNQRIDPGRIEARGVADREPVIQAIGPARLNRRVEMKIDCRQPGSGL